jgi:hypothetical protein
LRLYGCAKTIHAQDNEWAYLLKLFPEYTGARQIFKIDLKLVQTSCGYVVPYYDLVGKRLTLTKWAESHGREGIKKYWQVKKHQKS